MKHSRGHRSARPPYETRGCGPPVYADIDHIYRTTPLDRIPWHMETPPEALVQLVQEERVRPCKAVDLGCGAGNYAIYLAGEGFDITGIDSAPEAIRLAKEHARAAGVRCRFLVADLLGNMHELSETFDFAYDWEVLHHIYPEDRERYIKNVADLQNPGATYFSVCFAEADPQFGGKGKYRVTPIGTTLYFSTEEELRDLLSPYFVIRELGTIEVGGKYGTHQAIRVLAERKG